MLSSEEFESQLSEYLVSDSIVLSLKARLRHHLSQQLLTTQSKVTQQLDFFTRIAHSITCQHLEQSCCDLALSVFFPEANLTPTSILSTAELSQTLPRLSFSNVTAPSLLTHLVSEYYKPLPTTLSSSIQTDPISTSLEQTLSPATSVTPSFPPSHDPLVHREHELLSVITDIRCQLRDATLAHSQTEERAQRLSLEIEQKEEEHKRVEKEFKQALSQKDEVIEDCRSEISRKSREIDLLSRENKDLIEQVEQVNAKNDTFSLEKTRIHNLNQELLSQITALKREYTEIMEESSFKDDKINKLRKELSKNNEEVETLSTELDECKRKSRRLEKSSHDVSSSKRRIRFEDQIDEAAVSRRYAAVLDELRNDNQMLRTELSEVQFKYKEAQKTVETLRNLLKKEKLSQSIEQSPSVHMPSTLSPERPLHPPEPTTSTTTVKRSLWDSGVVSMANVAKKTEEEQVEKKEEDQNPREEAFFPEVISTPVSKRTSSSDQSSEVFGMSFSSEKNEDFDSDGLF
ncbi:hypothetical protein P9112_011427 [Eukaryota sp. TZLM1-RC]